MSHFVFILLCFIPYLGRADCWDKAGERYNIPSSLLKAIAEKESGFNKSAVNVNNNGSKDYGIMQINDFHSKRLREMGYSEEMLISHPCLSVHYAAKLLNEFMMMYGRGWEAVGAYNAGTSPKKKKERLKYAEDIYRRYLRIAAESKQNNRRI
ncbi:protein IpgF [Shigella flexneri]|uniref:type III secretion system lytic transglycosylase IpgF n=1 Tax=Shigella flexneri TaxID=623 RepID=UPI000DA45BCA|nr:type III secretion system lytic transglycosylase IpgF [Shigella flexneri]EIH5967923.1 type III secretion system lytic transglycosylase IpgF [Shigella flexneri]SRL55446.1 protein IpgF [Shigella flexneri]